MELRTFISLIIFFYGVSAKADFYIDSDTKIKSKCEQKFIKGLTNALKGPTDFKKSLSLNKNAHTIFIQFRNKEVELNNENYIVIRPSTKNLCQIKPTQFVNNINKLSKKGRFPASTNNSISPVYPELSETKKFIKYFF